MLFSDVTVCGSMLSDLNCKNTSDMFGQKHIDNKVSELSNWHSRWQTDWTEGAQCDAVVGQRRWGNGTGNNQVLLPQTQVVLVVERFAAE